MNAYFSFSGRMRRTKFILFVILLVVLQIILYPLLVAGTIGGIAATGDTASVLGPSLSLYLVLSTLFLIMWFALAVKRLHDCGFSGWLSLISLLPAILTPAVFATPIDPERGLEAIHYLPSVIGLGFFLVLALAPPSGDSNRYGPDPRDPSARWDSGHERRPAGGGESLSAGGAEWGDDAIERALKERQARLAREAAQASAPHAKPRASAKPAFGRR